MDEALYRLTSATITDRNKGIKEFTDLLSNPANFKKCSDSTWTRITRQLLEAVELERLAYNKPSKTAKSTSTRSAALVRLDQMLGLLRTCVSQHKSAMGAKTSKLLFPRVIELITITYQLKEFQSTTIDCIRILRDFFSHSFHFAHLNVTKCSTLMCLCFALLLGKKIPKTLLLVPNSEFNDEEVRVASKPVPAMLADGTRLLSLIAKSPTDLTITHSKTLLYHFKSILQTYPEDSTSHFHLISALCAILEELECNQISDLTHFATDLGNCVMRYWTTKSSECKEMIILALTYLFPFITQNIEQSRSDESEEPSAISETLARKIFRAILNDTDRVGLESISSSRLRFTEALGGTKVTPLSTQTWAWGSLDPSDDISQRHRVTSWASLQMGAAALKCVINLSDRVRIEPTVLSPRKRRKLEDDLDVFLQTMKQGHAAPSVIRRLQLVIFAIDLNWTSIHASAKSRMIHCILDLMNSENTEILDWVFLCITNLSSAYKRVDESTNSSQTNLSQDGGPTVDQWFDMWKCAIRRTSTPQCSRTASYAALFILKNRHVPNHLIYDGIKTFFSDLCVQGPNFPYDSVCLLVSECLSVTAGDMAFSGLLFEEKVTIWLSKTWREVDSTTALESASAGARSKKAYMTVFHPESAMVLLLRLTKMKMLPRLGSSCMVPNCPLVESLIYRDTTRAIRALSNHQEVANLSHTSSPTESLSRSRVRLSDIPDTADLLPGSELQNSISVMLAQSIDSVIGQIFDTESQRLNSASASVTSIQVAIETMIVGILFENARRSSGIRPHRETLDAARKLFSLVNEALEAHTWSVTQLAILLSCFEPVLYPSSEANNQELRHSLLSPGLASGLPRHKLADSNATRSSRTTLTSERLSCMRLITSVWTASAELQAQFLNFSEICQRILRGVNSAPDVTEANLTSTQTGGTAVGFDDNDDDNADTNVQVNRRDFLDGKRSFKTELGGSGMKRTIKLIVDVCIRGLITEASVEVAGDIANTIDVPAVATILEECSSTAIELIGLRVIECIDAGLMALTEIQSDQLIQFVGEKYMVPYAYSHNMHIQIFAIRLLRVSLHHWASGNQTKQSQSEHHAWTLFSHFLGLLSRNTVCSEVQLELALLLDAYLEFDPSQENWNKKSTTYLLKALQGNLKQPVDILIEYLQHDNIRVRYATAFLIPHAFELMHSVNIILASYWTTAIDLTHTFNYEHSVTTSLFFANVLLVSAELRPRAYQMLISNVTEKTETPDRVLRRSLIYTLLNCASHRLGFSGPDKLYGLYAAHIAAERYAINEEPLHPQHDFIGRDLNDFKKLEVTRANLYAVGPLYFLHKDTSAFQTCAEHAGMNIKEALRLCFPRIVGDLIARAFHGDHGEDNEKAGQMISPMLEEATAQCELELDMLSVERDRVATYLMLTSSANLTDTKMITDTLDPEAQDLYSALSSKLEECYLTEPALPFYSILSNIRAIKWLDELYSVFNEPNVVYSVVSNILTEISASPFVNDHLRYLLTITIFIALSHEVVRKSEPILILLLQGLLHLFSEEATFVPVCTLAEWIIDKIIKLERPPEIGHQEQNNFTQKLIISCVEKVSVFINSRTPKERNVSVAKEFNEWLLAQANSICDSADHPQHLLGNALLLYWPNASMTQCETPDVKDLLSRGWVESASSFKLIKHIVSSGLPGDRVEAGQLLFTLLLSARELCINPSLEDTASYFQLLSKNSGILNPPLLGQNTPWGPISFGRSKYLNSRHSAIHQILSLVVSRLETEDLHLLFRVTEFIRRAGVCEKLSEFEQHHSQLPRLSRVRTNLILSSSSRRTYDLYRPHLINFSTEFSSLVTIADRASEWTLGILKILIFDRLRKRPFFAQLSHVLEIDDTLASDILPCVVHACLLEDLVSPQASFKNDLSKHICALLQSPSTSDPVIHRLLDLITYLRSRPTPEGDPLGCNRWLDVPWRLLVKHATRLGMPSMGFLFLEIACEEGEISSLMSNTEKEFQDTVHLLYSSSLEPDAFYSLPPRDPSYWLLEHAAHEGEWESMFGISGALLQGKGSDLSHRAKTLRTIAQSHSGCGLDHLAYQVLQTGSSKKTEHPSRDLLEKECDSLPFELAWRASEWDLPQADQLNFDSSTRLYGALRAVNRQSDLELQSEIVNRCLIGQFKDLVNSPVAMLHPDAKVIGTALALEEISTWLTNHSAVQRKEYMKTLIDLPQGCDYEVLELISSVRRSLLHAEMDKQVQNMLGDEPNDTFRLAQQIEQSIRIKTCQEARLSGRIQHALNMIVPTKIMENEDMAQIGLEAKEEFAEVLWMKGKHSMALKMLEDVQSQQTSRPKAAIQLARLGDRMGAERRYTPQEIITRYFEKAISDLNPESEAAAFGQVSFTYATFADKQYRDVVASGEVARLTESTKRLSATVNYKASDRADSNAVKWKQRIYEEDCASLERYSHMQKSYLHGALQMYLNSLAFEDQHDDVVFRFVSLWFDHSDDDELNGALADAITKVPTHKFVRVAHQLSARLSKETTSNFQVVLTKLVTRMCFQHPFHCLPQILLLRQGVQSAISASESNTRLRRTSQQQPVPNDLTPSQLSRAKAADGVLTVVHKDNRRQATVASLVNVFDAYIEWAQFDVKRNMETKSQSGSLRIPTRIKLIGIKNQPIPVSTAHLPIDLTCRYKPDSMVCITGYQPEFKLAHGIHAPKITECRGSDGRLYRQLFKGGDDIRQDAVMEQVFDLVNQVLTRDGECRKRRLNFRTYKVIPLAEEAGLIEFVTNTSALGATLSPLHAKYNEPPDWNLKRAQSYLGAQRNASESKRIAAYKELMKHIRPAMRFWFMESQTCHQKWYEMRLNYTRTTATASIVGHILGLGDRHLSNILLDKETGDMIQIDLGIALDAGRHLPIPEKVPFRLTPDIIDGFGITKTEGVFRRCCEHTLRVLRENKDLVMTIIDVLKHDPLRVWVITEERARKLQESHDPETNEGGSRTCYPLTGQQEKKNKEEESKVSESASRALASVKEKLSDNLNVETMVNQLISEATNINHLGSIYCGWAPYY